MTTRSVLWYKRPAARFEEALPIGNGRMGAMLYGAPTCEMLRLNEDSIWSGGLRKRNNPDAAEGLQEVRALLRNGKIAAAEALAFQKLQGCPPNMMHYMPLGDLQIRWDIPEGNPTDYCRSLNLNTATAVCSFQIGDTHYKREVIASNPAQLIAIRLTVDKPFTSSAAMDGRDDYYDHNNVVQTDDGFTLQFDGGMGGKHGIQFAAAIRVLYTNGTILRTGNRLSVSDATETVYAIAVRTSYYHPDTDLLAQALADLRHAPADWATLSAQHIADYQALFGRVSLTLPDDTTNLPTDALLKAVQEHPDSPAARNALLRLYFDFGRYLMISGSRPRSLPLNLQGIWNVDMWPAWGGRFTININTEMNYWPAESCNLSECHLPLFDLIERMRSNGRETAREMYGCEGFCAHHNTDLWGDTAPQDLWMPATIWPMGAAWLCLHIFEHYRYTGDLAFLRKHYPALREAALFFTQYLTENAAGQLVTCPSVSPENTYRLSSGETGSLCSGPSMDSQIVYVLYSAVIESASLLETDSDFATLLTEQRSHLPKPQIGQYGQIMEWAVDYEEVEPGHRHVSQLFALHPDHRISPRRTPELAAAAEATLARRLEHGGGHTGWSRAWIANFYARLGKADAVLEHLTRLMQYSTNPNLFDMHPPFQIDGNFGGTAAIAEALLRSEPDGITLLHACPWDKGECRGLCAYGGFVLSLQWAEFRITQAQIQSRNGGVCRLFLQGEYAVTDCSSYPISIRKEADGAMCFDTVPMGEYRLLPL